MPWDTVLPETAKALSAPVTKLIEVAAAGCGKLYEPTGIVRKARAEGEAMVILEEAKSRGSDIARRSAQRLLDVEERRQGNIDSVLRQAAGLLPDTVSEKPVDRDWSARFFSEVQDIGNEEMQTVWAKLLAGEVTQPGAFSHRTLWVVKNLAPIEAALFNTLCKNSFRTLDDADPSPFVGIPDQTFWEGLGFTYMELQQLQNAGLVVNEPMGLEQRGVTHTVLRGPTVSLLLEAEKPTSLRLGEVSLTVAGAELSRICDWDIPPARIEAIETACRATFSVKRVRVVGDSTEGAQIIDLPATA
jgi:hypothetical protein